MNNFSKIGVIALCLLTTTVIFGQRLPAQEKIKTLKVAFITERLSLSSDEAQTFWPIYNEHEDNIEAIKREERVKIKAKLLDFEALTDKQADVLLAEIVDLEKQKHALHISYIEKMSRAITSKKTFMLIKAEEDFKKRLLRQIQQRNRRGE